MRSSAVLGVVFYALVVTLVLAGVVWPLVSVLGRPVFSLARLHDGRGRARALWCRRLAANLRDNVELDQEQLARLEACTAGPDTSQQLAELYREVCVPRVNARIKKSAVGACAATAISQTGVYDALSMLSINFALVRGIVTDCGFRPSNVQLARIYLRVMAGALLAGGLEELDLEEMLPLVLGQATSKVSGVLLASTAQGMVNAFTTYRVGVMTKHLLFDEGRALLAAAGSSRLLRRGHLPHEGDGLLLRDVPHGGGEALPGALRSLELRAQLGQDRRGVMARPRDVRFCQARRSSGRGRPRRRGVLIGAQGSRCGRGAPSASSDL